MTERQKEIFLDNDVTQKEDETFVQKLRMRKFGFKKDLLVKGLLTCILECVAEHVMVK